MDSQTIDKDVCLGYSSCIRVNGRPILPPLMSEARRHEMRQYREQAMQRETLRRVRLTREPAQLPPPQLFQEPFPPQLPPAQLFQEPSPPRLPPAQLFQEPSPPQLPPTPLFQEPSPPQLPPTPLFQEPSPPQLPSAQLFKLPSPHQLLPAIVVNEPTPLQVKQPASPSNVIEGPNTESEGKASTPRGVRFFDDNPTGTPNVTIRPHRRRTRAPFFDDGVVGDSESVAHSDGSDSWSTSTFVIETSQSHSVAHHSSFLSEGEVVDDSDDEYELDEAANLRVSKRGGFSTPDQVDTRGYSTPNQDLDIETERIGEPINPSCKENNNISGPFDGGMPTTSAAFKDDMSTVSAAFTNATSGGDSVFDSISTIGLSKLKTKMQTMSPSLFKIPGDTRSPLLKGVVFMDPLNRPHSVRKLPPEASDPRMKPKFDRVTACVRGYLVRRLLKTEKVNNLLQTIHDTVELILNLYAEGESGAGAAQGSRGLNVREGDVGLHARLVQQLDGACGAIHDIFFKLSTPERMAIISTDRIKMRSRALRDGVTKGASSGKKSITRATLRCMERRKTIAMRPPGPKRAKYQPDKLPLHVPSHIVPTPMTVAVGSQSVKSKQPKSFVVSPKRRRMTTFGKASTPPYLVTRGGTALARLAQLDKSKSSSNPNVSKPRNAPPSRAEGKSRKKLDATFVKPNKGTTRPLVSSNR